MRTTRPLRAELPIPVWDRLAAEAVEAGVPIGRYVRDLICARDARRVSASRVSRNA